MKNKFNINIKELNQILKTISAPSFVDPNYILEIYQIVIDGLDEINKVNSSFDYDSFNPIEIIQYILGETIYSLTSRSEEERKQFMLNEEIKSSMASIALDKYISLSQFAFRNRKLTNKYFPPMSSIYVCVNLMLNILNSYNRNDPNTTLISDLLIKSLSICKCTLDLLINGCETEAFSCWRTLHECECTLTVLNKYKMPLISEYLKHMRYGIAFKDGIKDKNVQDEIFYKMKDEMKNYNLKSKDIKKYIEYGWLYNTEEAKNDESFKLNFRDGLEKVAGLSNYTSRYEMSSEIIHSTPMLIYSNKEYFYYVTLLSLYESFFRLEKIFEELFIQNVNEEQKTYYLNMKKIYFAQLINIHERELINFKKIQRH